LRELVGHIPHENIREFKTRIEVLKYHLNYCHWQSVARNMIINGHMLEDIIKEEEDNVIFNEICETAIDELIRDTQYAINDGMN